MLWMVIVVCLAALALMILAPVYIGYATHTRLATSTCI